MIGSADTDGSGLCSKIEGALATILDGIKASQPLLCFATFSSDDSSHVQDAELGPGQSRALLRARALHLSSEIQNLFCSDGSHCSQPTTPVKPQIKVAAELSQESANDSTEERNTCAAIVGTDASNLPGDAAQVCWFCTSDAGELVRACQCTGEWEVSHPKCLRQFRQGLDWPAACALCGSDYLIERSTSSPIAAMPPEDEAAADRSELAYAAERTREPGNLRQPCDSVPALPALKWPENRLVMYTLDCVYTSCLLISCQSRMYLLVLFIHLFTVKLTAKADLACKYHS